MSTKTVGIILSYKTGPENENDIMAKCSWCALNVNRKLIYVNNTHQVIKNRIDCKRISYTWWAP